MGQLARPATVALLAGLTAAVANGGCAREKSYVVVTVRAAQGEFVDVAQLLVRVWNGPERRDRLFYPPDLVGKYRITTTETIDFSISFSTSLSGTIRVGVQPLDRDARSLGYGEAEQPIDPRHTVRVTVSVVPGAQPPPEDVNDGGVRPDSLGDSRSVCEPTSPGTCGGGRTCFVGCFGSEGAALCTMGGTRKAGEGCTTNADCEPGTQCLGFGCGSMCARHCRGDADCAGGRCNRALPCMGQATGFQTCSQTCDPRGNARTGCAPELACLFFAGDLVTCECPGSGRTAEEGAACTGVADCRPGLICVGASAGSTARVCRPVCKLSDGDCPAGRTCAPLRNPDFTVWGACIPN